MWKFPGQGLNPHHCGDPSHFSDNTGSLTCCTTRELQRPDSSPSPTACISWPSGLSTSCDLSLDVISFAQLIREIAAVWKLRKGSDHLLSSSSSVLPLWSMERNYRLGKVLLDQKMWKVCLGLRWVEREGACFKVTYNTSLLQGWNKGASCWGPLPAKKQEELLTHTHTHSHTLLKSNA